MPAKILKIILKPKEDRTIIEMTEWIRFITNSTVYEYAYAMKLNDLFK